MRSAHTSKGSRIQQAGRDTYSNWHAKASKRPQNSKIASLRESLQNTSKKRQTRAVQYGQQLLLFVPQKLQTSSVLEIGQIAEPDTIKKKKKKKCASSPQVKWTSSPEGQKSLCNLPEGIYCRRTRGWRVAPPMIAFQGQPSS